MRSELVVSCEHAYIEPLSAGTLSRTGGPGQRVPPPHTPIGDTTNKVLVCFGRANPPATAANTVKTFAPPDTKDA